jgi:hypothetical protein
MKKSSWKDTTKNIIYKQQLKIVKIIRKLKYYFSMDWFNKQYLLFKL